MRVALENLPARRLLGLRYNGYRFNSVRQLARLIGREPVMLTE